MMTLEKIDDINGKELENGHIIAVRYVWNSYVGEIRNGTLCATGANRHVFFSPHSIEKIHTHQILSHIDKNHPDYNKECSDWYNNEEGNCPVKIRVYEY